MEHYIQDGTQESEAGYCFLVKKEPVADVRTKNTADMKPETNQLITLVFGSAEKQINRKR